MCVCVPKVPTMGPKNPDPRGHTGERGGMGDGVRPGQCELRPKLLRHRLHQQVFSTEDWGRHCFKYWLVGASIRVSVFGYSGREL